ncbi:hypothetical protein [Epibacterium ulvae]|uniref:hypothetical protein n=1 Tax=Epibacterium ulvae TaxID=1156985 RepID=UPI00249059D2|nr:hypothetical protein [Epibacterium ulvae]
MKDWETGYVVLIGDHNWRKGSIFKACMAYVFGRRDRFEHLGMRCTVAWYKGKPYLIGLTEARHGG